MSGAFRLAAYLVVSMVMIGIWAIVGRNTGAWYPWPIWPIIGWGIGVAGHLVPVRLALRHRPREIRRA